MPFSAESTKSRPVSLSKCQSVPMDLELLVERELQPRAKNIIILMSSLVYYKQWIEISYKCIICFLCIEGSLIAKFFFYCLQFLFWKTFYHQSHNGNTVNGAVAGWRQLVYSQKGLMFFQIEQEVPGKTDSHILEALDRKSRGEGKGLNQWCESPLLHRIAPWG